MPLPAAPLADTTGEAPGQLNVVGELEVATNMAFRETPRQIHTKSGTFQVVTIAEADHFYSKARDALLTETVQWLRAL